MNRSVVVLLLALIPQLGRAQDVGTVAGVVRDRVTGALLPGVQVTIPGTRLETKTGPDGRFQVASVPVGQATVRTRLIGYASAEQLVLVNVGATTTADFQLQPQAVELEGMVVVGYGTQRRETITGAVSSVASDQFVQAPALDAGSLIAGRIPGLSITTPSGNPRAGTEISLRGATTIQGPTSPLVLVDGVPGSLETVAPQDIGSIDVLKDGSAAAIYGSRASNGVILISSKRDAGAAPTFRYEAWASRQTLYKTPDFLDAADYRRLIAQQTASAALDTLEDFGYSTDWQRLVLREPVSYTQNLTIAGGGGNTSYTAALTYENDQGIFARSENREMTGRVNVQHSMFDDRLHADLNLLTRVENADTGRDYNYAWRQTMIRNPTDRVTDSSSGMWQERGTYFYANPLGLIQEVNGDVEQRDLRVHGTVTLRPTNKLRLSLMSGTEKWSSLGGSATTFRHVNTTINGQNSTAGRYARSTMDRILELTGTYTGNVGRHNFTLLGGYGYQDFVDERFSVGTYDFPTDLFEYNRLQSGNALTTGQASMSSSKESYKTIGFFNRLTYDWDNRYLLMASVRYEGDSRFGAAHKWGMFPAVSAGWRLSKERFLERVHFIDDLKLRAGYGVTGIAPDDPYLSLTSYSYGGRMLYDGVWVQGISPSRNPNPDLRWERKDEINVGVDFSLFDFRLAGSLDLYRRDTKDLLYEYPVPVPPNLFGRMLANIGHMRNNGVEAQLTYDVVRRPGVRWTSSANWSTNSNKLVSLSNAAYQTDCFTPNGHTGEPIQQFTHRICVGGPIGNFYGYQSVDIDSNGVWIVLDKAGNPISIRDAKEDDRRILGNGIPKHYVAWNNAVQWKAFDLSATVRGAFDFQILNYQRMYYENPTIFEYNMLKSAFDSVYGKRLLNYDLSYVSYYVEEGSYLKLDNVTVGYRLPTRLAAALKASAGRFYVSGRNLHTWTQYQGLDPEVSTSGLSPGNDSRDKYPTTRTFSAGVSLTF